MEKFFSVFPKKEYKEGQIIIEGHKEPFGVCFLTEGKVRMFSLSPKGSELTIHIFEPGSFFPMMWALANTRNDYYFEALTDVRISIAPKDEVVEFLKSYPEELMKLTTRLFLGLSKFIGRFESLTTDQSRSRIASTLLFLAKHFGEHSKGSVKIRQRFTHSDIAKIAGTTRETVSVEMSALKKDKVVLYNTRNITIPDLKKLISRSK